MTVFIEHLPCVGELWVQFTLVVESFDEEVSDALNIAVKIPVVENDNTFRLHLSPFQIYCINMGCEMLFLQGSKTVHSTNKCNIATALIL